MQEGRFATAIPLGRGASGSVYRAFDAERGENVALKVVAVRDAQTAARVRRELRLQAALDHPDICRVYGLEQHRGEWVLVLQLVDGQPFDQAVAALPLHERLRLLARVARAVHYAHQQGIVHRDLKPANVLVGRDPDGSLHPFLSDFGLARAQDDTRLTMAGDALGTPAYMSPEQVRGLAVDARSDVWALGAMAYQCLSGRTPFEDVSGELSRAILEADPLPPPGSRALRQVVGKALEKRPRRRYATAQAFADDLERALDGQTPVAHSDVWRRALLRGVDRHRLALLLGGMTLLVGAAFALQQWQWQRQSAQAQAVAREFAQHAERAESLMRIAHLLPAHDLGIERAQVEASVAQLLRSASQLQASARASTELSLAQAELALDRPHTALDRLARADGLGLPEALLDPLRVRALDAAYELESASLERLGDRDQVQAEAERLRQVYLEPARDALRRMAAHSPLNPVQRAQLALYEGDADAALTELATLQPVSDLERLPLMAFEARLRYRRSVDIWYAGELADASAELERAIALLDAAGAIARSDGALWTLRCRAAGQSYAQAMELHGAKAELPDALDGSCATALLIEPEDLAARQALAVTGWRLARWQLRYRRGLSEAMADFEQALRQGLERHPDAPGLALALGGLLIAQAELNRDLGGPKVALLQEARDRLEHALQEQPQDLGLLVAAAQAWQRLVDIGGDEVEPSAFEQSRERYRRALALAPKAVALRSGFGHLLGERAHSEFAAGRSAQPWLDEGLEALELAHRQRPEHLPVMVNLILVHWTAAEVAAAAGGDPEPHFARAIELAETVLARDPRRLYALVNLGGVLTTQAEWRLLRGGDAKVALLQARAARERLGELAGDSLPIPCDLARLYLVEAALDPAAAQAWLDRAEAEARAGLIANADGDCDAMLAATLEARLQAGFEAADRISSRADELITRMRSTEARARVGCYLLLAAQRFPTAAAAAGWRERGGELLAAALASNPHLVRRLSLPASAVP